MATDGPQPNKRYKVGKVVKKHDLYNLHDQLPELWRGESGEPMSLRELAEQINVAIVRHAMEDADSEPLEGEAENAYRLLTDEDVSAGVRTQQRNRLERAGIDVDELEDDFVSHQSVYNYLTEGLDISKETADNQVSVEKHEQHMQRLRSRTTAVIESTLTDLQRNGRLSVGTADVIVDFQVFCQDCGTQYEFSELLQRGSCKCHNAPDQEE